MTASNFSRRSRILTAILDFALIGVASAIGIMVWMAGLLAIDPHTDRIAKHGASLFVIATVMTCVLFWLGPARGAWLAGRRGVRYAGLALIAMSGLVGWLWFRSFDLAPGGDDAAASFLWRGVQLGAFLLTLGSLGLLRRQATRRAWPLARLRCAAAVLLTGTLIYLGWDEEPAPSIARNHAVIAERNEDECSYQLTLRYSPAPGGARVFTPSVRPLAIPEEAEKRKAYLLAHRTEIETTWAGLGEVRAWWAEMAAQPVLGDRTTGLADQPFIRFAPVRAYMQHALAVAQLRALDGEGDDALAMVTEVFRVGARLEPSSCTLVRSMIAVVVQKAAIDAAGFIVDHAAVSVAARERFSAMLTEAARGEKEARRIVLTEVSYVSSVVRGAANMDPQWTGFMRGPWSVLSMPGSGMRQLAFNPQATINRLEDQLERIARLAEARDLEGLRALDESAHEALLGGFKVKNLFGRLLIPMMTPAYGGIIKSSWELEDKRAGLVARLRTPPPAAEVAGR